MPISVTCPACSTAFTVKDEYAGKRGKCPQCGEPVAIPVAAAPPIPAARPVAAPVVARPVVAARVPPKPPADEEASNKPATKRRRDEDDEDEPPVRSKRKRGEDDDEEPPASPKRKRGADDDDEAVSPKRKRGASRDDDDDVPKKKGKARDDDEDDKPTPKRARGAAADEDADPPKRKRGNDDDDDKPKGGRRRRRDDDDDDKPKKKSALPLILGILAGVLLLCCGGPTGLYFFWMKPAAEKVLQEAEAEVARRKKEQDEAMAKANPTAPTERPKEQPPVADLKAIELAQLQKADRQKYDKKWVRITGPVPRVNIETQPGKAEWGQLHVGVPPGAVVVCHFDAAEWAARGVIDDEFAYSVIGLYDDSVFGVSMRHCRVVGQVVAEPATPVAFADLVNSPAQYTGKMVEVSGLVKSAIPFGNGTSVTMTDGRADKTVRFTLPNNGKDFPPKVGDRLTVKAKVSVAGEGLVDLDFRKLVSRVPGDGKPPAPPPTAALSVADVLKDADKGFRNGNVAVRGKVKLVIEHVDGDQGTIVFEETDGRFLLHAVFPPGKWRKDFVRGGEDTIDVRGTLSGPLGNPGTGLHYDITDCELTRRVTKDGKEVPLPPVTPANKPVVATAENLAAEFAKNPNAAAAKYTDKTITVTGTVEKVTLPSGSRVTLKGVAADGTKKAYTVEVGMNLDMRDAAKEFKQGDTVKLTGKFSNFRPAVGTSTPNGVLLTAGVVEK